MRAMRDTTRATTATLSDSHDCSGRVDCAHKNVLPAGDLHEGAVGNYYQPSEEPPMLSFKGRAGNIRKQSFEID